MSKGDYTNTTHSEGTSQLFPLIIFLFAVVGALLMAFQQYDQTLSNNPSSLIVTAFHLFLTTAVGVSASSYGRMCGFGALLRWEHSQ
ncbi:hypothetical protein [Salibacterium halotolerans]|uniref:Uncharacterized protein n=1 Tax=Salibacterium halotolerans TaxID=1884432 RepID=A0A1I5L7D1_9BACI|nr:hypothetical protein [Salibacterium halotolerans]SFO93108.1 hypothetical protein SAMN05518683_101130 [Salibacterium halotolerans]